MPVAVVGNDGILVSDLNFINLETKAQTLIDTRPMAEVVVAKIDSNTRSEKIRVAN